MDSEYADDKFELSVQVTKLVGKELDVRPIELPVFTGTANLDDRGGYDIHTTMRRLAYDADRYMTTFRQEHCDHPEYNHDGECINCGRLHEVPED